MVDFFEKVCYTVINNWTYAVLGGEKMTRLEFLTVILSLKALLEENKVDKALDLINELISEAKKGG